MLVEETKKLKEIRKGLNTFLKPEYILALDKIIQLLERTTQLEDAEAQLKSEVK